MEKLFNKISNDEFTKDDLINLNINELNEDGWNLFMYACEQDKEEVVDLLLARGAKVEIKNQDFHPLLFIVENNNLNLFDKLISQIKTPLNEIKDEQGNSIIQIAAKKGYANMFEKIAQHTKDFTHRNNKGENILFSVLNSYELTNEQIDKLASNIVDKFDLENITNTSFNSIDLGKLVAVKNLSKLFNKLIELGYKFSSFSTQEELFNLATDNKSVGCISILIDNGVDASIDDVSKLEKIVLEEEGTQAIYDYLKTNYYFKANVNHATEENFLLEAIKAKKFDFAKDIIDLGWAINITNNKLDTPLLLSIKAENKELVELLLDKGASVTEITQQGNSPLLLAIALENMPIIDILLNNVFVLQNIQQQNDDGYTALTLAIQRRNFELVEKLLFKGVDLVFKEDYTSIDAGNEVEFLEAESRFKVDSLNALVQLGLNINARDSEDKTILIHNVIKKKEGNIRAILDLYGVDATIKDKFDKNALDYALENRDILTTKLLISNGVKEFKTKGRTSVLKTFDPNEEKDLEILSYLLNDSSLSEAIKIELVTFLFDKNFTSFEIFSEALNEDPTYDMESFQELTNPVVEAFIIKAIMNNMSNLIDSTINVQNIKKISFEDKINISFSLVKLNQNSLDKLADYAYFDLLNQEEKGNAFLSLLENEINDSIKYILEKNLLNLDNQEINKIISSNTVNIHTTSYSFVQEMLKPNIAEKINQSRKTKQTKTSKENLDI